MSVNNSAGARENTGPRVLVLTSTFPRWLGDSEPPFVFNLSRSLAESGFVVRVLAPDATNAARREFMGGCEVQRFTYMVPRALQKLAYGGILPNLKRNGWLRLEIPAFVAGELLATWRAVRDFRPDLVHAHWLLPQGLTAIVIGVITGTPVVVTGHGADVYGLRGSLAAALKRFVLRHAAAATVVSNDLRDAVLSTAPSSRVTVISMGVDTERFHPSKRDDALRASIAGEDALLLFVGRLAEKKGVRYLIEAMPAILAQVPNCRLVIAGDGPLRGDLEALSASLGLDGRVIFAGAKRPEDLPAYYASADVFVAPSVVVDSGDTESFGLVIAEAMASKCPVIASDVGGIGDLVKNGETGLLVPQRDSRAIANAVCEMLGNTQLRRRCSIAALRHVRDSASQRSVAGRYASLLREAIKPKQWAPVQQEGSHALEESSR